MPCGEMKRGKNQVHHDLRPDNQDVEIERPRYSVRPELRSVSEMFSGRYGGSRRERILCIAIA